MHLYYFEVCRNTQILSIPEKLSVPFVLEHPLPLLPTVYRRGFSASRKICMLSVARFAVSRASNQPSAEAARSCSTFAAASGTRRVTWREE